MKIHQINYNIDIRPVISKSCLLKPIRQSTVFRERENFSSLILQDKSLNNKTPTLSLFLMENSDLMEDSLKCGGVFYKRRT